MDLAETKKCLEEVAAGHKIVACLVGAESGVALADAISEYLGVQSNETETGSRRDKHSQQELVKEAGGFDMCVKQWVSN